MRRSAPWLVSSLALAWLVAASASANGSYSHVHISQLAHAQLPPGPLRDLLSDPQMIVAYEAGSMFPDSGYAVNDEYGELAHWEAFLDACIQHLRRTYDGDFSSLEARQQIAFVLGVASHGMADQSYDTTLLARAFEVDGPEPAGISVDQYADYFLTIDQGVSFTVDAWAPYAVLPPIIEEASGGHVVTEELLGMAMTRMSGVMAVQGDYDFAIAFHGTAWESFPFLGTHVYNEAAVGSVPWLGALVADYWQVVWDRIHGTNDPDRDLVVRTHPLDGAVNWPVDQSDGAAWSRIAVFFGYGVDRDTARPLLVLRDAAGDPIEVRLETAYDGRDRNLVFLVPTAPLAYDGEYTVEVGAGLTTLGGLTTTAPFVFSFRTRCAADRLADCPPLDPPLVTGPRPEPPPRRRPDAGPRLDAGTGTDASPAASPAGGGCTVTDSTVTDSTVTGRSSPALVAVVLLLGLALWRRRR
jgi:MYXO-CTERM domain-containing protein